MGAFAETVTQSIPIPPKRQRAAKPQRAAGTQAETHKAAPQSSARPAEGVEDAAETVLPEQAVMADVPLTPSEIAEDAAVSAEAAESFIENKRIGERIKYLRQRKHMGLVELGRHTGLSASFLSQLETGRVVPTLRNLARIAMVFSKDLSYFFEPERPELFRILRSAERQRLPQTGAEEPGYYFESLGQVPADQPIAPYVAEFLESTERRQAKAHRHTGNEFLYVLQGTLKLGHDGKIEALQGGDAVFFAAEAVHSYERLGSEPCEALILTMPEALRGTHSGSRLPLTKTAKA